MGYDADWDGQVTITPPLTWPQIKNAPKLRDLELVREETTTDTATGQTHTITASALQPKSGWGAYAGSSIEPELNNFLTAFPDHEFTGAITADGPEGNHWRYVIQGREVVYQTPQIVWPGEGHADAQHAAIIAAIRGFDFDDYRLDVNPNSEYAEWVADLATAIQKAITTEAAS